jgi:hypothetical protein
MIGLQTRTSVHMEAVITSVMYVLFSHVLASGGPGSSHYSYTHALKVRVINKPDENAAPSAPAPLELPKASTPAPETTLAAGPSSRQGSSDTVTVHSRAESSATATSTVVGESPAAGSKDKKDAKKDKKKDEKDEKDKKNQDLIGKLNSMVRLMHQSNLLGHMLTGWYRSPQISTTSSARRTGLSAVSTGVPRETPADGHQSPRSPCKSSLAHVRLSERSVEWFTDRIAS